MPWITFTQDVPGEPGGAPLYVAGYQADVSDKTAQKWIRAGHAAPGRLDVAPAVVAEETESEPQTDKPGRRGRKPDLSAIEGA